MFVQYQHFGRKRSSKLYNFIKTMNLGMSESNFELLEKQILSIMVGNLYHSASQMFC